MAPYACTGPNKPRIWEILVVIMAWGIGLALILFVGTLMVVLGKALWKATGGARGTRRGPPAP